MVDKKAAHAHACVGFIGTGSMGAPMARRLLVQGVPLVVFDTNARAVARLVARGARAARSPADVAERAGTVMICLPSLDAIREVLFGRKGVVQGKARRLVVNFSTTGGEFMRETAAALAKHRIALLDCPITGGSRGAAAGTLSISVSGTKAHYAEVEPLLSTLAKHRFHVGPEPGQAQTMKLINNLLSFLALAGTCEAFVMGVKAGLDPDMMVEVINTGTGRNSATETKMPLNILPRTFDYGAKMAIAWKDLRLCLDEAEALGVTMWIGSAVRQLWGYAVAHGGTEPDVSTLIKHLEKWGGVEVKGRAAARGKGRGK
jgi:2-hydroxy-3-oxopropionate reductase